MIIVCILLMRKLIEIYAKLNQIYLVICDVLNTKFYVRLKLQKWLPELQIKKTITNDHNGANSQLLHKRTKGRQNHLANDSYICMLSVAIYIQHRKLNNSLDEVTTLSKIFVS